MNAHSPALLTDLYQLTMLQAYFEEQMNETAVFEFFVRRLPATRNFLIAAGLEQALEFLETFRFDVEELNWLRDTGMFRSDFLEFLRGLRFRGDVHAMPEGTTFFPNEPILRVSASMPEAQIVETRLINLLQFQTLIASKAVRCVLAAPGKRLVDFGLRRAHGAEAGLLAARACYLAGFDATSDVMAGQMFEIPISGTMAHSFVEACDLEEDAFERFARANPNNTVFLIDTYDTEAGARKVVGLAQRLRSRGISIHGVRLDSGDLAMHAKKVRRILDEGGLRQTAIFASGNLDEAKLDALTRAGAPIDGFGVGSKVITSADVPYLDCAYKLQEYAGRPRCKHSEGKATWPGRKQVFRQRHSDGVMATDLVTLDGDISKGEPLLIPVMKSGERVHREDLEQIRRRVVQQLHGLPPPLQQLQPAPPYEVRISERLQELAATLHLPIAAVNSR